MFLAIDVGNSNIVLALHNGEDWFRTFRHETKVLQPVFYYENALSNICLEWGVQPYQINGCAISSVVPSLTQVIQASAANVLDFQPLVLNHAVFEKLDMHIPLIFEIGADLVSNAYGAIKLYQKLSIIVDFGTALTFTIADPIAGIKGVTIAPGIQIALNSLFSYTELLPTVDLIDPGTFIGVSTTTAIQSGIFYGYIGMIEYLINGIKRELNADCLIIATGGLSQVLTPLVHNFDYSNKELTLDGMRYIYLDINQQFT
jgi:type III pantothenate kinase